MSNNNNQLPLQPYMNQDPNLQQYYTLGYPSSSTSSATAANASTVVTNNDTSQFTEEDLTKLMNTLQEINGGTYPQHHSTILQAIELNEDLQHKAALQIEFIDQQLKLNEKAMKEATYSALAESRFGQRLFVHKVYTQPVQYFDQSELLEKARSNNDTPSNTNTPSTTAITVVRTQHDDFEDSEEEEQVNEEEEEEEEEELYHPMAEEDNNELNADNQRNLPNRSWSKYERSRLLEGIRSEAKRGITYSYYKNNQIARYWDVEKLTQSELENFPVSHINWETVSTTFVKSRTPNECAMQWTTQEHPLINKTPWSKQESEKLSLLVDQIGMNGQWERIAQELGTNRTISQCFSKYMYNKNYEAAKNLKWTPEEDKKLSDAVKIFGNCNWQQVAATMMKGRTGQQCLHRWTKSINPAIKKTKWTPEEAKLLRRAVGLYGEGNWKKVQRLVPGRTDMQCRERWVNIEQPSLVREKMNQEEVDRLVKLVEEVGPKWSYIRTFFPGRTDNNMLREYTAYTKQQEKIAKTIEKAQKKLEEKRRKEEAKAELARQKEQEKLEKQDKKKQAKQSKKRKAGNDEAEGSTPPKKKGRKRVVVSEEKENDTTEEEEQQVQQEEPTTQPTITKDKGKRKSSRQDIDNVEQSEEGGGNHGGDESSSSAAPAPVRKSTRYSLRATSKRKLA